MPLTTTHYNHPENGNPSEFLARCLVEALPYIVGFRGKTIVIKIGGSFMESTEGKQALIKDIALLQLLGMKVVVVHGGGKEISARLERRGIETRFECGYRVTCEETMEEVEMTLSGKIGKELVMMLNQSGIRAAGINGKDGMLLRANRMTLQTQYGPRDIGQVGEVDALDPHILTLFMDSNYIPVVSPIGFDETGETFNLNADVVAAAVAKALSAEKLILMTDVDGVYTDFKNRSGFISRMTLLECGDLLAGRATLAGMAPKLECAIDAITGGVTSVHILNGGTPHSLLMEIFSKDGIGTVIEKGAHTW